MRAIATNLKRAVIASEDAGFAEHSGVEWDALEKAWERNQRAEARAERQNEQSERRGARAARAAPPKLRPRVAPKVVGGSTITQQLAKNLFLGPERHLARKAQEFADHASCSRRVLDKRRILEIYLNTSNGAKACSAPRPPRSTISASPRGAARQPGRQPGWR